MSNNFCVQNLGIDSENYLNNEFYISAVIDSELLKDTNNLLIKLERFIKSKNLLYKNIIIHDQDINFVNNVDNFYNVKHKTVDTYEEIVNYTNSMKKFVSKGFSYEFIIFSCKENNNYYLVATFFHAIIDGVGGYLILEEFMEYLNSNRELTYDSSQGELLDLGIKESKIKIIEGDIEKVSRKSINYRYEFTKEYSEKFEKIMSIYGLSYLELSLLICMRLNFLFPHINLETIDCIVNLRSKKSQNKLGMYANILPLDFDYNSLELSSMSKMIRRSIYKVFRERSNTRYEFGKTNSNTLISMIYNHLEEKNYNVQWIKPDKIFYEYFITIMKGDSISFDFQIDESIDFEISNFSNYACKFIDELLSLNILNKIGLKDIKLGLLSELKQLNDVENYVFTTQSLKNNLGKVLNTKNECLISGKKQYSTNFIRSFIINNSSKFKEDKVVCIRGGEAEDQILVALSALYAGKPYSFISEKAPKNYIDYLVKQLDASIYNTNNFNFNIEKYEESVNIEFETFPDVVCYFMTSGTTGFPKLIPVKASSIAAFISINSSIFTESNATNLLTTDLSFDLSLHSLFNTLCNGGRLVITDLDKIYKTNYIENLIIQNNVSHILATPSFLSLIDYSKIPTSVALASVGEVLPVYLAKEILKYNFKLYNVYGPTETTCYVTEIEIDEQNVDIMPVGRPIKVADINVIDKFGNIVPEGYLGEIIISGPTVFNGYFGGNFNEFININGNYCYKTGDIGFIKSGLLYFSHRKDTQIKINGFRIEFEKIEEVVSKFLVDDNFYLTIIKNSIVLFHTSNYNKPEFDNYFKDQLPSYMIPQRVIHVSQIPLTKNYKVDKRALERIDYESRQINLSNDINLGANKISAILLDLGVDLKSSKDTLVKYCGLSSMDIFSLQTKLSAEGLNFELEALSNLTISELLQVSPKISNNRKIDYKFSELYEPSTIQSKFIINYFKNKRSTVDNVGAVIHFDNVIEAKEVCELIRKKILDNKNLHYYVSMSNGKLFMKLDPYFNIDIKSINLGEEIDVKKYVTYFNIFSSPLCSLKLLISNNGATVLIEFHHLIIDGISLQRLINNQNQTEIPYHNYDMVLKTNDGNIQGIKYFEENVIPFFDRSQYERKGKISSGKITFSLDKVKKLSKIENVSHQAIFSTAYVSALGLTEMVICTPVNLRKYPEDNLITGPLINLTGFKSVYTGNFHNSLYENNQSLESSLSYVDVNLENLVDSDLLMTHLLTIFDTYDSTEIGEIDYELSNSLYDEKFKFNTYIYREKDKYKVYMYSSYLTESQISEILEKMKLCIESSEKIK